MAPKIKCKLTNLETGKITELESIQAARHVLKLTSAQVHYYLRKAEAKGQPCILNGYKLERG
jgi:hypothetical protein